MRRIGLLLIIFPFVTNSLNIQAFITKFISASSAQSFAYLNVIVVAIGGVFFWRNNERFPVLIKLWFSFFLCYYIIGTVAAEIHGTSTPYLKSLIPLIYFISYSIFLKFESNRKIFLQIVGATFLTSCIFVIFFQWINFSMDSEGIYKYTLERAGGVYGDANQSAVVSILSFVFIFHKYKPARPAGYFIKVLALAISLYALFLTFSKTGFVVFILIILLASYKMLTRRNVVLIICLVPAILFVIIRSALQSDYLTALQKTRIENLINILTLNTSEIEMSNRDVLLRNMLGYVYENPVFGNGIYFSNIIRGHNTIIGVWADAGIIAFLIFLWILIKYYLESLKSYDSTKYFSLSVLVTLTIFMLSLQTIINQPYLLCIFVYLAYLIDATSVTEPKYHHN